MTFKCHKQEEHGENVLYPVNDIFLTPKSDSFVGTVGGDGTMIFWDYIKKNKINDF